MPGHRSLDADLFYGHNMKQEGSNSLSFTVSGALPASLQAQCLSNLASLFKDALSHSMKSKVVGTNQLYLTADKNVEAFRNVSEGARAIAQR